MSNGYEFGTYPFPAKVDYGPPPSQLSCPVSPDLIDSKNYANSEPPIEYFYQPNSEIEAKKNETGFALTDQNATERRMALTVGKLLQESGEGVWIIGSDDPEADGDVFFGFASGADLVSCRDALEGTPLDLFPVPIEGQLVGFRLMTKQVHELLLAGSAHGNDETVVSCLEQDRREKWYKAGHLIREREQYEKTSQKQQAA